ncbi:MAG: hypothetical protein ABI588_10660, partial [Arenimonas sp.]
MKLSLARIALPCALMLSACAKAPAPPAPPEAPPPAAAASPAPEGGPMAPDTVKEFPSLEIRSFDGK